MIFPTAMFWVWMAMRECIQIALSEQVDAAETQEESDAAYNLACQHVASALRKKFEVEG